MSLKLYNTLTRSKEGFEPTDPTNIRMYVCGPTVYATPHLGNGRPIVVFDLLFRILKNLYPNVTYVRNITDVDDKINKRALEAGCTIGALTERTTKEFQEICTFLGALAPTHEPRVTAHMPQIIEMIKRLLEKGAAYQAEGHVLFRVAQAKGYGTLSGKDEESLLAGARVEVAPYKESAQDFVLWKPSKDGEPAWEAPFGAGRPGWHIECSAMAAEYLGETFDIHGGGIDLIFPHHENEIAQTTCCFDVPLMAKVWMHNGHLQVDGAKMAKSVGNVVSFNDVMEKYEGDVVRIAMLQSHYRQPLNWSENALHMASNFLERYYLALREMDAATYEAITPALSDDHIRQALYDDLNTPLVFARFNELIAELNTADAKGVRAEKLVENMRFLGLAKQAPSQWLKSGKGILLAEEEIEWLINKRAEAKKERHFEEADRIRKLLEEEGILLDDTPQGTLWRKKGS